MINLRNILGNGLAKGLAKGLVFVFVAGAFFGLSAGAVKAQNTVSSSDIVDGTIVTADIADGAIALAKAVGTEVTGTARQTAGTGGIVVLDGANYRIARNLVTTDSILDGTIVNADIAANTIDVTRLATSDPGNNYNGNALIVHLPLAEGVEGKPNYRINDGFVTTESILNGTIIEEDLEASFVSDLKAGAALAAGSVTTTHIKDATIGADDIAEGVITGFHIEDGSIERTDLKDGAVTIPKLTYDLSGTAGSNNLLVRTGDGDSSDPYVYRINDDLVDTGSLVNFAVTGDKIASEGLLKRHFAADATGSSSSNNLLVRTGAGSGTDPYVYEINNGLVVAKSIKDGVITANKISNSTISVGKLSADLQTRTNSIGYSGDTASATSTTSLWARVKAATTATSTPAATTGIADRAVTGIKIAINTILAENIAVGVVTLERMAASALATAGSPNLLVRTGEAGSYTYKINTGLVNGASIEDGTVSTIDIRNTAIVADKLGNSAVITRTIAPRAVTFDKIGDGAVRTDKIQDEAVTTAKLSTALQTVITSVGLVGDTPDAEADTLWGRVNAIVKRDPQAATTDNVLFRMGADGGPYTYRIDNNLVQTESILNGEVKLLDLALAAGATTESQSHTVAPAVSSSGLFNVVVSDSGNYRIGRGLVTTESILDGEVLIKDLATAATATSELAAGTNNANRSAASTTNTYSVVVLDGTAYRVGRNLVTTESIRDGQIRAADLVPNATAGSLLNKLGLVESPTGLVGVTEPDKAYDTATGYVSTTATAPNVLTGHFSERLQWLSAITGTWSDEVGSWNLFATSVYTGDILFASNRDWGEIPLTERTNLIWELLDQLRQDAGTILTISGSTFTTSFTTDLLNTMGTDIFVLSTDARWTGATLAQRTNYLNFNVQALWAAINALQGASGLDIDPPSSGNEGDQGNGGGGDGGGAPGDTVPDDLNQDPTNQPGPEAAEDDPPGNSDVDKDYDVNPDDDKQRKDVVDDPNTVPVEPFNDANQQEQINAGLHFEEELRDYFTDELGLTFKINNDGSITDVSEDTNKNSGGAASYSLDDDTLTQSYDSNNVNHQEQLNSLVNTDQDMIEVLGRDIGLAYSLGADGSLTLVAKDNDIAQPFTFQPKTGKTSEDIANQQEQINYALHSIGLNDLQIKKYADKYIDEALDSIKSNAQYTGLSKVEKNLVDDIINRWKEGENITEDYAGYSVLPQIVKDIITSKVREGANYGGLLDALVTKYNLTVADGATDADKRTAILASTNTALSAEDADILDDILIYVQSGNGVLTNGIIDQISDSSLRLAIIRMFGLDNGLKPSNSGSASLYQRTEYAIRQIDDHILPTLDRHEGLIQQNRELIQRNIRGIAMAAALHNTYVEQGRKISLDLNMANFEGINGFALGFGWRFNANTQFHFSTSTTSDLEESLMRTGINFQW